ncbi:hypothetical protein RB195_018352 [Necator americanus]|uniref:Uncharacterized protein n=1 Tax=Necator americanus TaxID=51031 RepID=A0ABR1C9E0_NECAM
MRGDQISGYHDVFDFGPRRHMHDSPCKLSQTVYLQARTVSTDADLHPLLGVAERIKLHETALQEAKSGRRDVRQMNDDILSISGEELPSRNVGSVGFVVHPSVVHLVDSHGSCHFVWPFFASALCAKNPSTSSTPTHQHQQLMNPNWRK